MSGWTYLLKKRQSFNKVFFLCRALFGVRELKRAFALTALKPLPTLQGPDNPYRRCF